MSNSPPIDVVWIWITGDMLASLPMKALGISARRVLDALMIEHMNHAGLENGRLISTYRQLEQFGVTKADVRKGLAELQCAGFVSLTRQGLRQASDGTPSLYALTWLPINPNSPTAIEGSMHWMKVDAQMRLAGANHAAGARAWLKEHIGTKARPSRRAPRGDIYSSPQSRGGRGDQMRGREKVVALVPRDHVRGAEDSPEGLATNFDGEQPPKRMRAPR